MTSPRTPVANTPQYQGAHCHAEAQSDSHSVHFSHFPPSALRTPVVAHEELKTRSELERKLKDVSDMYRQRASPPITHLFDYIFIGGFPNGATLEELRRLGVTRIINVVSGEHPTRSPAQKMFAITDFPAQDAPDYFILFHYYEKFREVVDTERRAGGRVFVHCYAGVNRSVALCAAYLMEREFMTVFEAVAHFHRNQRFVILDNVGFQQQLIDFQLNVLQHDEMHQNRSLPFGD